MGQRAFGSHLTFFCMKLKISVLLLFVIIVFGYEACMKMTNHESQSSQSQQQIESAKQFFLQNVRPLTHTVTGNPRLDAIKTPYWEEAQVATSSKGPAVIVPVFYQQDLVVTTNFSGQQILPLNQITRLLLYKTSSGYQAQVLTAFPDTNAHNLTGFFSGILFIEDWQGQRLTRFSMRGNQVLVESIDTSVGKGSHNTVESNSTRTTDGIEAECGTISGYNYSPALPGETYSWSESSGCDYTASGSPGNPSLLPSSEYESFVRLPIGPGTRLATVEVSPPANVIANIADYLKCFSNYGGNDHSYQVTVCVDQPVPGSRTAWTTVPQGIGGSSSGANPVDAGHTWLVLTENFGTYSIVRNVGFYPQTNVYPWAASAQGAFGDDDGHSYNISLTATVDNGQFFNILNYVSQGNSPGYLYNLNTNNCTTFAINALSAGNVILPSTKSSWPDGGFGNDPGDLGEDILSMPLSGNMTRSSSYSAKPNQYNCN